MNMTNNNTFSEVTIIGLDYPQVTGIILPHFRNKEIKNIFEVIVIGLDCPQITGIILSLFRKQRFKNAKVKLSCCFFHTNFSGICPFCSTFKNSIPDAPLLVIEFAS